MNDHPWKIATAGRRIAAFVVDMIVLMPWWLLFSWLFIRLFEVQLPSQSLPLTDYVTEVALQADPFTLGPVFILASLFLLYSCFSVALSGSTAGMKLLRIHVATEDGTPPNLAQCAIRAIGVVLSVSYFFLGVLWILFDDRGQGFHDKLSATRVIRRMSQDAK